MAQARASEFTRGHNSFSGVDIKAVFAGRAVGSLQGVSYSVSREKAPINCEGVGRSKTSLKSENPEMATPRVRPMVTSESRRDFGDYL